MIWRLSTPNNFVVYGKKYKVWVLVYGKQLVPLKSLFDFGIIGASEVLLFDQL